jgi:REP element-mobilizing transposase RayT
MPDHIHLLIPSIRGQLPMIDNVKAYLSGQKEHPKRTTFQDEFRELSRRHNLEWDERYLWD